MIKIYESVNAIYSYNGGSYVRVYAEELHDLVIRVETDYEYIEITIKKGGRKIEAADEIAEIVSAMVDDENVIDVVDIVDVVYETIKRFQEA